MIDKPAKKSKKKASNKAYGYLRVSSRGQVDKDGFTRQKQGITRWAEANGKEVIRFYEECVSGTKQVDERVVFYRMTYDGDEEGVNCILVENTSRIARDHIVSEIALEDFRKREITVLDVATGMDLTVPSQDPTALFIRRMFSIVDQYQKDQFVYRTRASRERIRESGVRCEGGRPWGWYPEEKLACEWAMKNVDRLGTREIARRLNAMGVKPRRGKKFTSRIVYWYLRQTKELREEALNHNRSEE